MPTPALSRSAKMYQERHSPERRNTDRGPGPRLSPGQNAVNTLPLHPPFPLPEILQAEGGHPPDAGLTQPWLHGTEEVI